MDKRMRKEKSLLPELPKPKLYGSEHADVTLISWGSTKHACIEAMEMMQVSGLSVNVLHFIYLYPLDTKVILPMLSRLKTVIVVENNYEAQFAGMLKEYVGFVADDHLLKYNGLPFYPAEIVQYLTKKCL
jgi:2-oxoglutarate ferredoxin oxidoreductase subunit alpha